MDHPLRNLSVAVAAVLAAACVGDASAQDEVTGRSTYVSNTGQVVHCVSTESGRTYCGEPHVRYTIVQPTPTCVEGRTWGFDDRGVWVTGGCRADFTVADGNRPVERSTYVTDSGRIVHCVSTANGRSYCGRPHMRYVIAGQPAPACVEGSTWGVDDRGVWVTGGCKADFTVAEERPAERVYQADNSQVVHCVSTDEGKTYCGSAHTRYVIRGAADPSCVEGRTWGVDDHGVWVTGGCRADFSVQD